MESQRGWLVVQDTVGQRELAFHRPEEFRTAGDVLEHHLKIQPPNVNFLVLFRDSDGKRNNVLSDQSSDDFR